MEDGRSKVIIEKLIDMIENGQGVPFSSSKVAVPKDEAITMLKELENIVSNELKTYHEFNDRRGRIIAEAKKEAEDIVYEAEQTASRIRVTKRMSSYGSGFRADGLDREDKLALRTAHDMYAASVIYTDEMLTEVNDVVAEAYDIIYNQYGRMVSELEEKARIIAQNKAELMSGLKELSREERYSNIMELSQLIANELYDEKKRQSEMYEAAATSMIEDDELQAENYSQEYNDAAVLESSRNEEDMVPENTDYVEEVVSERTNNAEKVVSERANNAEKVVSERANNTEKVVSERANNAEKVVSERANNTEKVVSEKNDNAEKSDSEIKANINPTGVDKKNTDKSQKKTAKEEKNVDTKNEDAKPVSKANNTKNKMKTNPMLNRSRVSLEMFDRATIDRKMSGNAKASKSEPESAPSDNKSKAVANTLNMFKKAGKSEE